MIKLIGINNSKTVPLYYPNTIIDQVHRLLRKRREEASQRQKISLANDDASFIEDSNFMHRSGMKMVNPQKA